MRSERFADVVRAQRQGAVDQPLQPVRGLRQQHDVAPEVQPDLQQQHRHQIPQIDKAEHGHRRGVVRRQVHLQRALRMPQVQLQRQRRHQQKRQRRQQRQPVGGLHRLHVEDALQRRQNERARHQPGNIRIQHDQHAPLQLHFVRIHEAFNAAHKPPHPALDLLTAPIRPGRCRKPWRRSPSAASAPARCASSEIHGSDRSDSSGPPSCRAPVGQSPQHAVVSPFVMR